MPKPRVPQEEQAARRKQWREENAEKRREYITAWRAKNKDHIAEYAKAYQRTEESKAVAKAWSKRYYAEVIRNDPGKLARVRECSKQWATANPDKVNAKTERYKNSHREALNERAKAAYHAKSEDERKVQRAARAEYFRQWQEANREKVSDDRRKRYVENREEYRARGKQYYADNRHEFIVRAEDRQRNLRQRGSHTKEEIDTLYSAQRGKCAGCGLKLARTRERANKAHYEVDHVMPVALGGSNTADNLQLLCGPCNHRKYAMHPDEWAARIGKLFV